MGRMPAALPSTIWALDHLRRSDCPPAVRRYTLDLLLTLAAVECSATVGRPALVSPALLRDLVIIIRKLLAGSGWLQANAGRAAMFNTLLVTPDPPPLAELDQILADVL